MVAYEWCGGRRCGGVAGGGVVGGNGAGCRERETVEESGEGGGEGDCARWECRDRETVGVVTN